MAIALQERTIFHGSGETVQFPEIRESKFTKDFGYGFCCTKSFSQAERWAKKHADTQKHKVPTVNLYSYQPNTSLKYKVFERMSDEWLDFIALCRNADEKTPHDYDIVEGPMADDEVWNYVEDYLDGRISRKAFWALAEFKHPAHQISFHTEAAFQCLFFERAVSV